MPKNEVVIRLLLSPTHGRHRRAARIASRLGLGLVLCVELWPAGIAAADPPSGGVDDPPRLVGPIQFEDRQEASGIEFVLDNSTTPDKPIIDSMLGASRCSISTTTVCSTCSSPTAPRSPP